MLFPNQTMLLVSHCNNASEHYFSIHISFRPSGCRESSEMHYWTTHDVKFWIHWSNHQLPPPPHAPHQFKLHIVSLAQLFGEILWPWALTFDHHQDIPSQVITHLGEYPFTHTSVKTTPFLHRFTSRDKSLNYATMHLNYCHRAGSPRFLAWPVRDNQLNDRTWRPRWSAAVFREIKTQAVTNRLRGRRSPKLIALDKLLPAIIGSCIMNGVVPARERRDRSGKGICLRLILIDHFFALVCRRFTGSSHFMGSCNIHKDTKEDPCHCDMVCVSFRAV